MNEWQNNNPQQEERKINLTRLALVLLKNAWVIAIITLIFGIAAYIYSACFIAPTYRSSFTAYVDSRGENLESSTTTSADLTASAKLTYLYQDIILSRSVLLDAAELCGADYGYVTLKNMVTISVDTNSALITVTVSDTDPAQATQLAAAIAQVAPSHVARIREGSAMRILDEPVQPIHKSAPSNTQNAIKGALIGFVLSAVLVIVVDLLNDKVRDAEELESRHGLITIGVIPDLATADDGSGYYSQHNTKGGAKK